MEFHPSLLKNPSILEWILLATSLYTVQVFAYAFCFSPVRHIPGPWYARISRLPLLYATYKFRRTEWVAGLMKEYDTSTIVIAPNQINTTNEEAMKIIYDRTAIKTRFYASMGSWKGIKSTLGFLDYTSAAPTRNNLIQCFQNKNLASLVENIQGHVLACVNVLREKAENDEKLDGVTIFRLLALDIVTDVLWGEEKTLLSAESQATPAFLKRFHAFSRWNAFKASVPGAELYVRLFGSQYWRTLRNDCNDLDITANEAIDRWNERGEKAHDRDVLSMLRSMEDAEDPLKRLPASHITAYMVEMLAAGSSTTSMSAAITCFMLARNPTAQRNLRKELFDTFPDPTVIDPKLMMTLPLLDGALRETMRMFPMIPGPLERHLGTPIVLNGRTIPPGVVASTSAYTQGRLADVFPDPDAWKPERWDKRTKRMESNWIPFGTGCRACPGSNLALTELKYMLGTIFRVFRSVVAEGHDNDTMELADIFAAGSRTGHCWLKFEVAENEI
jgi:cytochrome P450